MAILNNQREIKAWLTQALPQRVSKSQVNFFLQPASFDGVPPLRNNSIPAAISASKPPTASKSPTTPAFTPTSHIQQPDISKSIKQPPTNPLPKSRENLHISTPRNASKPRPAGNASDPNTNGSFRPPKPPIPAIEPATEPLFISTQISDFSDPQSDEDLIDTNMLRVTKPETTEPRPSRNPPTSKTAPKRSAETEPLAIKKQRSSTPIGQSGLVFEESHGLHRSNPAQASKNGDLYLKNGDPSLKNRDQSSKNGYLYLKNPDPSSKNTTLKNPDQSNSIQSGKPQNNIPSMQKQVFSQNSAQNNGQFDYSDQESTVPLLHEYIRMCEAKIHLLTKCNAVNDSTSLSQDAKKLWQTKQFQPRLKQLDSSLLQLRPKLKFLESSPPLEDFSNMSGFSSMPSAQESSQNDINVLEDFKGISSAPNSLGNSPYFMQVTQDLPNIKQEQVQPSKQRPTGLDIPETNQSRTELERNSEFQVPDSLPTPSYNLNIQEARQIIQERKNRAETGVPVSTAIVTDVNESEDDFGDGFMAGLVSSQIENDDTDLSGFIAQDDAENHESESIDGSYVTQPTQFNNIDTDEDEDVLESQSSGSEAEIDKIRLSQDVANRLGVTYEAIEVLDDDISEYKNEMEDDERDGNEGNGEIGENEGNGENIDGNDLNIDGNDLNIDGNDLNFDGNVQNFDGNDLNIDGNDGIGENSADFTTQLNEGRDEIVEIPSEDDLDDMDLDGLKELSFIKSEPQEKLHVISDSDFSDNDDELIQLSKSVATKPGAISEPFLDEVYRILRNNFRLNEFRSNQLEAIVATLKGKDVFVLIPTGGGKSLCFQLPALVKGGHTRGTTVVVSPLISLMQDQVQHLVSKNIRAGMISSKGTADERNSTFKALTSGQLDLVYLSPEMINNSGRVQKVISKLHENSMLARVVVDEAHCVSSWGHDFRPDYKGMSFFKQNFPDVPIMALTATANEKVRLDIVHNLQMHEPVLLKQSFNRVNLMYEVKNKPPNIYEWIREYIDLKQRKKTGIIYCHSKQSCETTAQKLNDYGVSCMYYHAGMDPTERFDVQEKWQKNQIQVICATIAFGMGIDKPDVRFVIHLYIPRSLEGYYQETGRAGRDGNGSECIMFYSYKDARALQSLIQRDDKLEDSAREAHLTKLQQVVQYCENKTDCRRQQVLHFFNETFDPKQCRKMCDNCCSNVVAVTRDVTNHCVAITKLVQSIQADKVTIIHCQDVYKGARHGKILKLNHHNNPYHGLGKDLDRGDIERIFYHLQSEGGLLEYQVMRGGFATTYVKLGPRANVIMKGTQKIQLSFTEKEPKIAKNRSIKNKSSSVSTGNFRIGNHDNQDAKETTNGKPGNVRLNASKIPDLSSLRYTESFISARDLNSPRGVSGSFTRISLPEQNFGGQVNESNSEMINHAFTELRNLRTQKSQELGFGRAQYFISDALLKEMALKLPTNAVDFAKLDTITKEKVPFFQHFKKLLGLLSRNRKKAMDGASSGAPCSTSSGAPCSTSSGAPSSTTRGPSQKSQRRRVVKTKKPSQFRAMPI